MHGTRRQKRQITPVSEWHTRPFCTALSRSRAQHNELNQNESRGGSRKLIRFGFPIGKKTSIENRDMDQWRRKQRTGVCLLTVIVIPSSGLARVVILPPHRFLFLRHPQNHRWMEEGRDSHTERGGSLATTTLLQPPGALCSTKGQKRQAKESCGATLAPNVHALRDGL